MAVADGLGPCLLKIIMPYQPSNKSTTLWIFSASLLCLAVASCAYHPVLHTWTWHLDLPELHWAKHPATLISFLRDCIVAAIIAAGCAWFAKRNSLKAHWVGTILTFGLMCSNIMLGLRELSMVAKDDFGDYPHLWFLCVLHWLTGFLALGCLMPLLLHLRREQPV